MPFQFFPAVPAGKRLVVESVSAQVGLNPYPIVFEKQLSTYFGYFVAAPSTARGYVNSAVRIYYEAGEVPAARIPIDIDTPNNLSLVVTIVGTLVPAAD